jgi:hypothetical protein
MILNIVIGMFFLKGRFYDIQDSYIKLIHLSFEDTTGQLLIFTGLVRAAFALPQLKA